VTRLSVALIAALSVAAMPGPARGAGPPPADRAAWEQVDIVPMPKRIRLTGRRLPLAKAAIVLGATPSEQDRIGARWINDHIVAKGGKALPVIAGSAPGDATLRIVVGTRRTNKAIDAAARAGLFRLGPGVPGKRGYVLHPRRQGARTDILLGGADPVGALYACVTLAGLLEAEKGSIVLREAEIVDWPDYPTVSEGWNLYRPELGDLGSRCRWAGDKCPPELRARYLAAMKRHLDRLLAWKISCYKAEQLRYWRTLSPTFLATYREITAYAKARGIHSLVYALKPFVGLQSDFPDAPKRCLTGTGRSQYVKFIRCWSMDAERRQTAARLGDFIRACGLTDVGFHDSDTGGFLNPARWEDRCDVCRKRWGDDFAAATIHKHRIYHEEIRKRAPDCRLHFTLYPYNISVLSQQGAERYQTDRYGPSPSVPLVARRLRERFTDFWTRVTAGLPPDVSFCIRENVPENVRRFHQLTAPHGTFIWYKVGSEQWRAFFDESPRWAPTFYSGRDDVMFTVSLERFVPLKALAVREYAWNVEAPGATGWAMAPQKERWRHAEPRGEIYSVVLPHIVRNLFGRRAAPELTRALACNVAFNQVFDNRWRMIPILTTHEKMKWQADEAEKACRELDKLFGRFVASGDRLGMTPYAARRFVYIREVFHCSRWMARGRAENLLARQLAKGGKLDDARAAVARGRAVVEQARRDMDRLLAERPEDPLYNAKVDSRRRLPHWKVYTPGNQVDYDVLEKMLAQTESELPSLAAAGELPGGALEALAKRSAIHVAETPAPPKIDGRLDEPAWRRAVPAESFFVFPGEPQIARAHSLARFLRDDKTLYFGAKCWMPGGAPVRTKARDRDGNTHEDEQVELFLMPPHMHGGYVQIKVNAAGSVADKRVTIEPKKPGGPAKNIDPAWDATDMQVKTGSGPGLWQVELAIPLSALSAADWSGAWHANVCRDFKGPATGELSSVMRPSRRDFHDTRAFLRLVPDPNPAPPPDVEIDMTNLKQATRTFDNRVATELEFGLEVRTGRVLHSVGLTAEAYDASGRLHAQKALKKLDHLVYFWRSGDRFSIAFEQVLEAGAVRLILESDGTRHQRWIRLGGWQGTEKKAPLFAPPGKQKADDPLEQSPGLAGPCNLPSEIVGPGKKHIKILGRRRGTIEFWVKPLWKPRHSLDIRAPWKPRHTLVHCGILRREYPAHTNQSALVLYYDAGSKSIHFVIRNRQYAGWAVSCRLGNEKTWQQPAWHHLACVWNSSDKPDDWLRLYIDGVRAGAKTRVSKPERLGDDKAVALDETAFAIQLGSLNSGRYPARAILDELRISRTARYQADFTPVRKPFALDKDTSALFHFDGNLDGQGMSEEGTRYPVPGVAGVLELH